MFVLIVYISSSYCRCIRSRCSGLKGLRGELGKTINILRISSRLLAASAYRAVNYTVSMVIFLYFSNFGTSSFITCIIISKNIYYTELLLGTCHFNFAVISTRGICYSIYISKRFWGRQERVKE